MRAHAPRRDRTAIVQKEERAAPGRAFPKPVHLNLESRLAALQQVQAELARLMAAAGVEPDAADNVGMAIRESVINAVKHGNHLDPRKHVHVAMAMDDDGLEVVVADEGAGFDLDSLPDPFAPDNLLRPDGRGMLMMRSFMDEVAFTFPPSGGTVVRMRKRLSRPMSTP